MDLQSGASEHTYSSNLTTTLLDGIPPGGRLGLQVVSSRRLLLLCLFYFPESFHIRKQYPTDSSLLRIISWFSLGTRAFKQQRARLELDTGDMVFHDM